MAEATTYRAVLRRLRVTPRKVRLIGDAVRGKNVSKALDMLRLMNKRSAPVISKLIQSAVANAKDRATVDVDRLVIAEVQVGQGPSYKRFIPRAQGRASPILKRTSNIVIKLKEK